MGCGFSQPHSFEDQDQIPAKLAPAQEQKQSMAERCLEDCLPCATETPPRTHSQPAGWRVFTYDRDRTKFIKAAILVLSNNGTHDLNDCFIELFFTRIGQYTRAGLAVIEDHSVRNSILGRRLGLDRRSAFVWLMLEIELQLESLLQSTSTSRDVSQIEPLRRAPATTYMLPVPGIAAPPPRALLGPRPLPNLPHVARHRSTPALPRVRSVSFLPLNAMARQRSHGQLGQTAGGLSRNSSMRTMSLLDTPARDEQLAYFGKEDLSESALGKVDEEELFSRL